MYTEQRIKPRSASKSSNNNNKKVAVSSIMAPRRHANATTTPEMREFIRKSDLSVAELSRLLNISEATVRKWKQRDSLEDASHKPLNLNTTLSPVEEFVVVELRRSQLLSLDELLQITLEFINANVSRAGLARCLKRHGVSRLAGIQDDEYPESGDQLVHMRIEHIPTHQATAPEVSSDSLAQVLCGGDESKTVDVVKVSSIKLPQFSETQRERCLFVAHDPQSRWIYVDIYEDDIVDAAGRYMSHALRKAPFHIRRMLADNYNEFMQHYRLIKEEDVSAAIDIETIEQADHPAGDPTNNN